MITAIAFGKKVQVLDVFEYESGYKEFIVRDLKPGEFGDDIVYIVDRAHLHEVKQHGVQQSPAPVEIEELNGKRVLV